MTSDVGRKLAFSAADITLVAVSDTLRRLKPGLSEAQYQYITQEVFKLVGEPVPLSIIPLIDLVEDIVTQQIITYLTMFELSIGQQVLYSTGYEF